MEHLWENVDEFDYCREPVDDGVNLDASSGAAETATEIENSVPGIVEDIGRPENETGIADKSPRPDSVPIHLFSPLASFLPRFLLFQIVQPH